MFRLEGDRPDYSPFQPELDETYPVTRLRISRENKGKIILGDFTPEDWARLLSYSPKRKMGEALALGDMVTAALRAGQWVHVPESGIGVIQVEKHDFHAGLTVKSCESSPEARRGVQNLLCNGYIERDKDNKGVAQVRLTTKSMQLLNERIGFKWKSRKN